jgi:hypothetical protein
MSRIQLEIACSMHVAHLSLERNFFTRLAIFVNPESRFSCLSCLVFLTSWAQLRARRTAILTGIVCTSLYYFQKNARIALGSVLLTKYHSGDQVKKTERLAGRVARMRERRGAYRTLVGKPEGRRPLGRPRRRWEEKIKVDLLAVGRGGGHGLDQSGSG